MPEVHVTATVTDAHDGLTRLLGDVARFGYELTSVVLDNTAKQGRVQIGFIVEGTDPAIVGARLSRHPTIIWLEATKGSIATAPQESV